VGGRREVGGEDMAWRKKRKGREKIKKRKKREGKLDILQPQYNR
jgi:hypothetical protein